MRYIQPIWRNVSPLASMGALTIQSIVAKKDRLVGKTYSPMTQLSCIAALGSLSTHLTIL